MSVEVIVVGAGRFGRETLDVIEAHNDEADETDVIAVLGVADDAPSTGNLERIEVRGYTYLGKVADAFRENTRALSVIAIGAPHIRARVARLLGADGVQSISVIHPAATIGSDLRAGIGNVICGGVQVSTNVSLGDYVHLNPGVVIGHDAKLGDFASVNPNATVSGECSIEEESLIGAASVILQGLTVGRGSVVGAGACVTKDIGRRVTAVGVPARPVARV